MSTKDVLQMPKINAYAIATEDDIGAVRFEQVRSGKLWRGWFGTVYGCKVAGSGQVGFDTFNDARADALLFVDKCAAAIRAME